MARSEVNVRGQEDRQFDSTQHVFETKIRVGEANRQPLHDDRNCQFEILLDEEERELLQDRNYKHCSEFRRRE
jgi:hypothetical protein